MARPFSSPVDSDMWLCEHPSVSNRPPRFRTMIDLSAIATTGGWNTVIVSLWLVATVGCGGIGRSARPEVVDPASCGDASLPPGAELDPRLAPMAAAADSASLLAAGEVLLATAEREAAAVFHRTALAADAGVDERMARAREHRRFLEDWTMSDPPILVVGADRFLVAEAIARSLAAAAVAQGDFVGAAMWLDRAIAPGLASRELESCRAWVRSSGAANMVEGP